MTTFAAASRCRTHAAAVSRPFGRPAAEIRIWIDTGVGIDAQ